MRPLRLTMKGFRSHQHSTEIDFADRSLVAIVGPTGAGKSSVLDGISFALYGKTPSVKAGTKRLICSRTNSAHVNLRFSVDEREFEVTRVLRRSGSGEHLLTEVDSGNRINGESAVNAVIQELLALDFDAFCSSALLAQGRFSRFLEAAPTEQMRILKGVFRVDRVDLLREAAKGRVASCNGDLRELEGRRSQIPGDLEDQIADATEKRAEAEKWAGALAAALPNEKKVLARAERAVAELEAAREGRAGVEKVSEALPDDVELAALLEHAEGSVEAVRSAQQRLDVATEEEQAAAEAYEELVDSYGAKDGLTVARASAQQRVKLLDDLANIESALKDARATASAAEDESSKAADGADLSQQAHKAAQADLDSARAEHAAHELRGHLVAGKPCPVCEQKVEGIPKRARPKALSTLEKACEEAAAGAAKATKALAEAQAAVAGAKAEVAGLGGRVRDERTRLLEVEESLGSYLTEDDPLASIEVRIAELTVAQSRIEVARKAREDLRADLDAALKTEHEAASARARFARRLIVAATRLGMEPCEVDAPAEELHAQALELRAAALDALAKADEALDAAGNAAETAAAELGVLRAEVGLEAGEPIDEAMVRARAQAASEETRLEQLNAFREQLGELAGKEAVIRSERGRWAQLVEDLTDRHFIKFLLEDRRRLLSELGSEQLRSLTGRYRFDDEAEFNVVDELDADKQRDVETLSGGEMFLASLALALGLAEAVARHGGRLQCFFLDEGFGSLDPESLDLALDGIERIVSSDRLIGLVSHVPALAERVEDRIVLEKGPDGMTIVTSGDAADLVERLQAAGAL